ncbi:hypothetical protein BaOVIS_008630 [Babesia ovis]|uniref:Methionine aminopeptidase n=1 Tax=Babesia ovis TaxID=5869 RepID=A0A9W5WU41_BABOV|nr:hypothetical protein BaOVIS_008630 [Babesia ovis]
MPLGSYFARAKKLNATPTVQFGEYQVLPSHEIPSHITRPPYASLTDPSQLRAYYSRPCPHAEVKSNDQIRAMRDAAKIAADCLRCCMSATRENMTAEDIDRIGHEFIVSRGAYPAGVGFHGFPKAICISVNEVACHGIPNTRPFQPGDIVSYDCTVFYNNVFGDCAGTVIVGGESSTDEAGSTLVRVAKECVDRAIEAVAPGTEFATLADIVSQHASSFGFGVIREFGGHFIGDMMHMPPMIQFCQPSSTPGKMQPGQVFTIEPIICEGDPEIYTWEDGWTIATHDNGRCAQFEHTILVTDSGCEILTI